MGGCGVIGITKEIWKDISDYHGRYQVSNIGRVKTLERRVWNGWNHITLPEKIMKLQEDWKGYFNIGLSKNGIQKQFKVHRLVAIEFIENPNHLPYINHKNENPKNNNVTNLEWCTPLYNNTYNDAHIRGGFSSRNNKNTSTPIHKLNKEGEILNTYPSMQEAQRNGFSQACISRCCSGENKTHKGYIWRYASD